MCQCLGLSSRGTNTTHHHKNRADAKTEITCAFVVCGRYSRCRLACVLTEQADSKLAQSVEAQALAWARRRESDLQTTIADQLRASTPRSHTHQHAHMASASMPLLSTPPKHPTAPPQSTRSARSTRFNQYGVNVERGDGDVSHLISSDSDSDNGMAGTDSFWLWCEMMGSGRGLERAH